MFFKGLLTKAYAMNSDLYARRAYLNQPIDLVKMD